MSAAYAEKPTSVGNPFSAAGCGGITAEITRLNGRQVVLIKQQHRAGSVVVLRSRLSDLRRALEAIEEEPARRSRKQRTRKTSSVDFSHASHKEFALILDRYEIEWEYKPRTFAVEWDDEGNFVSSFTPDFYLPGHRPPEQGNAGHGRYVELITDAERPIAEKTRKVRLLQRQYRDIRIKTVYGPDYHRAVAELVPRDASD